MNSFLNFSKSEIVVLIILIFTVLFIIILPKICFKQPQYALSVKDEGFIQQLKIQEETYSNYQKTNYQNRYPSNSRNTKPYHDFKPGAESYKTVPAKKLELTVEINSADSLELQKIPGIGTVLSRRIVAYRTRLGGFYSTEQLLEVYGIDSLKYAQIKRFITVNSDFVKKISVHQATYRDLIKHPYLDAYLVKHILSYQQKNQTFQDFSALKKSANLYDSLAQKLEPYLDFK